MTSLIDVIFLLLLFFMLSSTFSKFSEIELSAGNPGAGNAPDTAPLFLELGENALRLNGQNQTLATLAQAISNARQGAEQPLLVSLKRGATAQRLTDLLVTLRPLNGLSLTVLEGRG